MIHRSFLTFISEFRPMNSSSPLSSPAADRIPKKPLAYRIVKRLFDIVGAFLGLVVLFVPFLVISIAIVIDSPGASPIFVQKRLGKNGKPFRLLKFRSMIPHADEMVDALKDQNEMDGPAFKIKRDPRVTRVGMFLRKTSLDETPQLWNILLGSMSFVGPRPPIPREVEQYTEEQMIRLAVTPGLTCYWQIQPRRNDLTFDQWVELDRKYIREQSVGTDLRIIFHTALAVLRLEGI